MNIHKPSKLSPRQIILLVENYISALAGNEILVALHNHVAMADVTIKFIKFDESERTVIRNVFEAAQGQNKLFYLLDAIRQDGFDLEYEYLLSQTDNEKKVESVQPDKNNIERLLDWITTETEYVDIRGIGETKANQAVVFPVLSLYTELYVQSGLTNLDLNQGRLRGQMRIPLTNMVESTRCLIIMGDPGAGKTTFLRFIARKKVAERKTIPVYIRLADVYEYSLKENTPLEPKILLQFFSHVAKEARQNFSISELENFAEHGNCMFLLDSLDELPSDDSREKMVFVVEKATRLWSECKFILTSRPLPIRAKSIPIGFEKVAIDYWSRDDIKAFLKAWTSLLYPDASDEKKRRYWGTLLSTIMERSDLRNLARNAVMVTAMAVVNYNEKRLPEGRADLLESLIYWLIRAKNRSGEFAYATPKFIEGVYRELALSMLEIEGGRKRRVGRLWAAKIISRFFGGDNELALEFLHREETETGVLVRRGEGDLEFWHLSFQEYLAAKEIAGKTDDYETGWWSKIRNRLDTAEWKEVLVFVPACLNRLGGERVDLFFNRLGESCKDSDLATKARRVALGGSILRDLRLTEYQLLQSPAWKKVLIDVGPIFSEHGESIPLEIRYQAAVAYGLGGDSRLREFDETWIKLPKGDFYMGAQSVDPKQNNFDSDAAPWEAPVINVTIQAFEIRKYPITVQEFEEFIRDDGYSQESCWQEMGSLDWLKTNAIKAPLDWDDQLMYPNCPVSGISWFEANAYCVWLTERDLRNINYKLPTESQWEYAARHGVFPPLKFPWGNEVVPGDNVQANFAWSGLRRKTPVGMFPKCITTDGIIDMFGNVEEWCVDSWTPDHSDRPLDGMPIKDDDARCHVVRGGSTIRFPRLCRITYRSRIYKDKRYLTVGFRPIRTSPTITQ